MQVSLIFVIIISFMSCTLFRRISDSRFTWIHDFEENLTESDGPVPFLPNLQVCMDGQINPGWAG